METKIILTGATGMVGEGVLLECLSQSDVKEVLMINRRPSPVKHPKLKELLVPDFFHMDEFTYHLKGYDACFYCAGISSAGMKEKEYCLITYDTTLSFANQLLILNPDMVFNFVSGSHTDSSEKGKIMWARVKGKTENALSKLPFKAVYHFRPGLMKPTTGQQNIKSFYKIINWLFPVFKALMPNQVISISEVGLAMINSVHFGYPKQILEIEDIKVLAKEGLD